MEMQQQLHALLKLIDTRIMPDITLAIESIRIGDPQAAINLLTATLKDVNEQGQEIFLVPVNKPEVWGAEQSPSGSNRQQSDPVLPTTGDLGTSTDGGEQQAPPSSEAPTTA